VYVQVLELGRICRQVRFFSAATQEKAARLGRQLEQAVVVLPVARLKVVDIYLNRLPPY
jgi:hypothetical protein